MSAEHAGAVAAARSHLAAKPEPGRPLSALPAGFASTVGALHVVAEQLLKPKRELETGNEIALGFTPGGFGTIPWDHGVASGNSGSARVEGTELVLVEDGEERRVPAGDLRAGAQLLGVSAPQEESVTIDPAGAAALTDWYALGTVALAGLIERHGELDPSPIRLWPEHFDVAAELGEDGSGRRANYGASPGDDDHPEPYAYVGPWNGEIRGEGWNSTAFPGAELGHADLLAADDQLAATVAFMESRLAAFEGDG
jgi:hypothetical protein